MQPRSKGHKWSNDGVVAKNSVEISASTTKETQSGGSSSDEEYEDMDDIANKVGSVGAKEDKLRKENEKYRLARPCCGRGARALLLLSKKIQGRRESRS